MTTLLVDGDILVYKAAFAAEEVHSFDGGETWASTADLGTARAYFNDRLGELVADTKAKNVIIALSGPNNWRREVYPPYKAQRKKTRRPVLLKPLNEWIISLPVREGRMVYLRDTLEADDVLGILATSKIIKGPRIIASIDKDLLQIPGDHLNIDKMTSTQVTVEEGNYFHLQQTLTGDVVDNYPGLPGCGPVGAARILDTPEPWKAIVAAYAKKGLTEADALVQARVARICRAEDYDFKTKVVKLWTPPNYGP